MFLSFISLIFCIVFISDYGYCYKKPAGCVFPFTYNGRRYDDCTKEGSELAWCSVSEIYNGTFMFCETVKTVDDIDFIKLLKKAEKHTEKLENIIGSVTKKIKDCRSCADAAYVLNRALIDISIIYLDQNKRLEGIKKQHENIQETIRELNKYYQLRRCRQTERGGDYLGHVSRTSSGKDCQMWISQLPHRHENTEDNAYSDNDIVLAHYNCRNPDNSLSPWCYTTKREVRFEYCAIPRCHVDCKIDENDKSAKPLCDAYQSVPCPQGYVALNNRCYKWYSEPTNFTEAERICNESNSHLVSIHSAVEAEFIEHNVVQKSSTYWIGLNDRKDEKKFEWTDGSTVDYIRFYQGEPNDVKNEDCVVVGKYPGQHSAWNDVDCSKKLPFVCKVLV